jgi:hypothetical protein
MAHARGRFELLAGAVLATASFAAARTHGIPVGSAPAGRPAPPPRALAGPAPDVRG